MTEPGAPERRPAEQDQGVGPGTIAAMMMLGPVGAFLAFSGGRWVQRKSIQRQVYTLLAMAFVALLGLVVWLFLNDNGWSLLIVLGVVLLAAFAAPGWIRRRRSRDAAP